MEKIGLGVSIGVALAAIISSIAVALINNIYQAKLRKQELNHNLELRKQELLHERELRRLEINGEINKRNFDSYYCNKRDAYNEFLKIAGTYPSTFDEIQKLSSVASVAVLFSLPETQQEIQSFVETVRSTSTDTTTKHWALVSRLSTILSNELQTVYEKSCG